MMYQHVFEICDIEYNYIGMYLINYKVVRNFNELQKELFNLWTSAKNGSPNEAKAVLESPMQFFAET